MPEIRLALAQINCTVGDLKGNTDKICQYILEAKKVEVDLIAFPELTVTGYPPEDLLLKTNFLHENQECLDKIALCCGEIVVIVGFVETTDKIFNAAAILGDNRLLGTYKKCLLPNYGVFDEYRYFSVGTEYPIWMINGIRAGVNICEDIWSSDGPAVFQAKSGADILINISSSPYHMGRRQERLDTLSAIALDNEVVICYVNMIGGQDEIIFDGDSMVLDAEGRLLAEGKQFEEDLVIVDLDIKNKHHSKLLKDLNSTGTMPTICIPSVQHKTEKPPLPDRQISPLEPNAEVYSALVLGTRDYLIKNGFSKAVIGLSGGIDSSLVALIAVDALSKENVVGVLMPSTYSSEGSLKDASQLAQNLGLSNFTIPISDILNSYLDEFKTVFKDIKPSLTEENLQARIRGNILMALSNEFGWLVLTTGNKSEVATGYCTIYGDMVGGFAIIKDVPKTLVFELARYRNKIGNKEIIPENVINKEPSAELRPNQKDTDSLPPYELLDPIINAYVESDKSLSQIISMGYNRELAAHVINMIDRSEYKRRQASPGVKITPRAFGKDRRLPITNAYRDE